MLKAYRELELEDLAEGRPGVGTFVTGTLARESLAWTFQWIEAGIFVALAALLIWLAIRRLRRIA